MTRETLVEAILAAARAAHEANRAYCIGLGDESQKSWNEAEGWQRVSAIKGVAAIIASGRFVPELSHDAWCQEKVRTGWTYGPVKDASKKEHPCLVKYHELPYPLQAKDAIFGAVVVGILKERGVIVRQSSYDQMNTEIILALLGDLVRD
jgi:hypothetical protein